MNKAPLLPAITLLNAFAAPETSHAEEVQPVQYYIFYRITETGALDQPTTRLIRSAPDNKSAIKIVSKNQEPDKQDSGGEEDQKIVLWKREDKRQGKKKRGHDITGITDPPGQKSLLPSVPQDPEVRLFGYKPVNIISNVRNDLKYVLRKSR